MKVKSLFLILILSVMFIGCQPKTTMKSKVVHHVFFWLKNPGNEADRAMLVEGLNTLRAIDEIKDLQIGVPASTMQRDVVDNSFDVSELMCFESAETQDVYQTHPIHKAFVDNYSHLWERVVVYDMVVL